MAVERVAAALTNSAGFASSLTIANVVVSGGSNRCLVVHAGSRDLTGSVQGVAFKEAGGDKALTDGGVKAVGAAGAARRVAEQWYLCCPANETQDVVITFDEEISRCVGAAFELINVDQSSPVGTGKTATPGFVQTHPITFTDMGADDLAVATLIFIVSCAHHRKESDDGLRETHRSAGQIQKQLEAEYQRWQGTRHRMGGSSSSGVDCSGFVKAVYKNIFKSWLGKLKNVFTFAARFGRVVLNLLKQL